MERLDIRKHSAKYRTHRDIENALAWNAVKKFLQENEREELFEYISAIKITEKNITISVKNSLIKQELSLYKEQFSHFLCENLEENYGSHKRTVKII